MLFLKGDCNGSKNKARKNDTNYILQEKRETFIDHSHMRCSYTEEIELPWSLRIQQHFSMTNKPSSTQFKQLINSC